MKASDTPALRKHWRRNRLLTCALLIVWFSVILGAALYARELNRQTVFGIPMAFYVFAQGAPIFFLIIIGVYARRMNRLDRRHITKQPEESA